MNSKKSARQPGSRLGQHLTVMGVIDPGAKEPVYLVWHRSRWCPLACKVFPSVAEAESEATLLREFSHPYILRALGVEHPGCLLMPYLEGSTLSSLIDTAPRRWLGVSDAIRVALHIGAALIHIHERGYLHLDIKPDNVIVGSDGRPVLFDFGTARKIRSPRPSRPIGTNAYIAPEECRLGKAGPAADVFSLGVTLYEMLTGDLPFGKSGGNTFRQLKAEAFDMAKFRSGVPAQLEQLVFACLEKDPDFRPELPDLMVSLNTFISRGPGMWPETFDPMRGTFDAHTASRCRRPKSIGALRRKRQARVLRPTAASQTVQ